MRPVTRRPLWSGTVAGLAVALLALAGCSTQTPQAPPPVTVTPTITPSRSVPPTPKVPVVWPLTGVQTAELPDRPAVAVKIENSHLARPQSGLNQADMVWETIIDFDVSRLVAVFHSQTPTHIGPIRSVRPMDMSIVAPLHGPLVFSGGQEGILAMVPQAGIQGMNNDYAAPGMYRIATRQAPHNVYGDVPVFVQNADASHSSTPPAQFHFARTAQQATAVLQGTDATKISMHLSSQSDPAWSWSADGWQRWEGKDPAVVADGSRIQATNVVLVVAPHPASGFLAQLGAPVPTYDLVGEGQALVATGGKTIPATWHKTAQDQPVTLTTADGKDVLLAPGNTWVELVPQGTGSFTVDPPAGG
ncbi:DUF3048 domain-containing protein [Isoptericola sp. b441]|uniref:DUF3048 domain-containing protein n=1 Tax=Actinotalea lenta TaxID=3064654 RepID=A0ABT9DA36_9CELL|nr:MULTISPECIES: DUF3048 domain-containing protein [unclassified Isoptericola]MDO8105807.1 DUF3048 domain-containing protein [Isoptericola sp. b441]MDO8122512.1 DUF3048 domain-containing protein [Isoptericola sp. b490]